MKRRHHEHCCLAGHRLTRYAAAFATAELRRPTARPADLERTPDAYARRVPQRALDATVVDTACAATWAGEK